MKIETQYGTDIAVDDIIDSEGDVHIALTSANLRLDAYLSDQDMLALRDQLNMLIAKKALKQTAE